jgi:hypothetical protein
MCARGLGLNRVIRGQDRALTFRAASSLASERRETGRRLAYAAA